MHRTSKNPVFKSGEPVHVAVVGPSYVTNDAEFIKRMIKDNEIIGVVLLMHGNGGGEIELPWNDLIEFWPIPPCYGLVDIAKQHLVRRYKEKIYGTD